jgi:hypothetical protein
MHRRLFRPEPAIDSNRIVVTNLEHTMLIDETIECAEHVVEKMNDLNRLHLAANVRKADYIGEQ